MSNRVLTRAERQRQTREALVESAAELIAERGLHAASLEAIAEHAGYTTGAIYSNFANKWELWTALGERYTSAIQLSHYLKGGLTLREILITIASDTYKMARGVSRTQLLLDYEFELALLRDKKLNAKAAAEDKQVHDEDAANLERFLEATGEGLPFPASEFLFVLRTALKAMFVAVATDPESISEEGFVKTFLLLAEREREP